MEAFLSFLAGGTSSDGGTGESWWDFLLLAIGGGLFTLLMPCTYPMIPLTVNFFAKQATGGRRVLPLAVAYGSGIVGSFIAIGLVVSQVIGTSVSHAAGNVWVNLGIALLFLVLGLSLLGAFFLRLPSALQGLLGGGSRGGYLGALLMGFTFAMTAFTCTAPFAGAVLAQGVQTGSTLRPVVGMAIYALTIAVPFVVLAVMPGLLGRLPRAGSWMNEFKHLGGLIEIAAAFKFLVIVDIAWNLGFFTRGVVLSLWSVIALVAGGYTLGLIRMHGDDRLEGVGAGRLLLAVLWFALGLWFAAGLLGGADLGVIESFFPVAAGASSSPW